MNKLLMQFQAHNVGGSSKKIQLTKYSRKSDLPVVAGVVVTTRLLLLNNPQPITRRGPR